MRPVAPEQRTAGFVTFSASAVSDANPEAAKSYLDRVKAYIPAEVVAFFIFVNSLVLGLNLRVTTQPPGSDPQSVLTPDGYVAISALVFGVILSLLYARVAAKSSGQPWVVQAIVTAIAFLVWSYAVGGRGYEVLNLAVVPSVAGLLMAAFTVVSGFIVPIKKP
jgi:hypothetical protein